MADFKEHNGALAKLPNILSIIRILLTPLFVYFLFKGGVYLWWSMIVFTIAALTDAYDGYIARKYGAVTTWGTFLDPVADKVLVLSAFLVFAIYDLFPYWMFVVMLIRDVMVTASRIALMRTGYSIAPMQLGKLKTFIQLFSIYFVIIYLVLETYGHIALCDILATRIEKFLLIPILMYGVIIITVLSGLSYLIQNYTALSRLYTKRS